MEFLNFGLLQFLGMFGAMAAFSAALYLLDRTRRRQVVSTLRFWTASGQPAAVSRKRRVQQPWSLMLQLLGMGLLLLAMAEFQFGGALNQRRDHVLILDTSAWMAATMPGRAGATVMDSARANAIGWLRAVPSSDRVLLVRADGLATPATAWETDRRRTARAILDSQPGSTALNLAENLAFARDLQRQSGAASGEIVYVGPGRVSERDAGAVAASAGSSFRVLTVEDNAENCGIRSLGARRSAAARGTWSVLVRARNYGRAARAVSVTLNFGNVPQGMHSLTLAPGAEVETSFEVRSAAAGILEARLYPRDAFAADNYAALELPEQRTLHIVVYSAHPEAIRPALASDARVHAEFRTLTSYTPLNDGLVVLDGFRPAKAPAGDVWWINPPADNPPVPIRARAEHPEAVRWTPDQALTQGLRDGRMQMGPASVFEPGTGATTLAQVEQGPVMVSRGRAVVTGFDPFTGAMRYELATPILVGNILRWAAPDIFRDIDLTAQSAGAVSSPLPQGVEVAGVQVLTDSGATLPFSIREHAVEFFAGEPGRVRVLAGNTERVYSLTLPGMWDARWTPPAGVRHGIPAWTERVRRPATLWPVLALAGLALLLLEWAMYGSLRRLQISRPAVEPA